MRRVDRSLVSAPAVLVGDKSRGGKELAKATVFFEAQARAEAAAATTGAPAAAPKTRTKKENSFEFSAYSDEAVKYALDKLFFGKCAYCESRYARPGAGRRRTLPAEGTHRRRRQSSRLLVAGDGLG
ncbi:hypothetical protein [Rhizobium ruizarguesonis]